MPALAALFQVITAAHQALGPDGTRDLIQYFVTRYELTPEQLQNLQSNYRDLIEIAARLRAEGGQ